VEIEEPRVHSPLLSATENDVHQVVTLVGCHQHPVDLQHFAKISDYSGDKQVHTGYLYLRVKFNVSAFFEDTQACRICYSYGWYMWCICCQQGVRLLIDLLCPIRNILFPVSLMEFPGEKPGGT
jgi:desulfoferrodoxin (superoxide reductase-like protein)